MKEKEHLEKLREDCLGARILSNDILEWIHSKNLWNVWVPKSYGGLELSLTSGLSKLKELAKIDGSLGWTVTLCSGANYFIGNLNPEAASQLFKNDATACLGGSGSVGGKAEKVGSNYLVSGTWPYATGARYLSHFTLNAELIESGETIKDEDGTPVIKSFIVPAREVNIINDWNAMGLKASDTCSFTLDSVSVSEEYSFLYNKTYLPQAIYQIPFSVFADLTLWVNYLGMAEHFAEAAGKSDKILALTQELHLANQKFQKWSSNCEKLSDEGAHFKDSFCGELHAEAAQTIEKLSQAMITAYPLLGIKACSTNTSLNQIFRDYFTATQHHNFTK